MGDVRSGSAATDHMGALAGDLFGQGWRDGRVLAFAGDWGASDWGRGRLHRVRRDPAGGAGATRPDPLSGRVRMPWRAAAAPASRHRVSQALSTCALTGGARDP